MQWRTLSDRLFLGANLKVWTKHTDRRLFRLDFSPATDGGHLEISQGDGSLTVGQPIIISAESSPIVITLPLPILIAIDKRRLSLRADRTLRVSLSVLDIEPIININENMSNQNSNICNSFTIQSTTQSTTLLAANSNRKFASITNNSYSTLYIDYDNAVSAENHAVRIPPFYYFEMPTQIQTRIIGLWDRVDGSAFVREFV